MKQITLTFLALLSFVFLAPSCKKEKDNVIGEKYINIGALLSLTGNWSSLGITSQAAIDIAMEDINAYMVETGSPYRFRSTVYDTKLDAALARKYMASAEADGCRFVLGPQSSAEAGAVIEYATISDMMVVSQGSTAGSLSLEGDNLFRFCPDDHIEGSAMAKTIYKDGISAIVTAARDDAGNKGLQLSVGNAFKDAGGLVSATVPYSNAANTDFKPLLADIKAKVLEHHTSKTYSQIAVYLASFDECVEMFQLAAHDPVLSLVRWYGGDGTALSAALIANSTAADFAIATKYFAPSFGLPEQSAVKWQPLSDEIVKRTSLTPDAFALAAYDAVWVIAMSYNVFPTEIPQFAEQKAEFVVQAAKYDGATGNTNLNAAGDRATGSFDYFGIVKDGNSYKWTVVGKSE